MRARPPGRERPRSRCWPRARGVAAASLLLGCGDGSPSASPGGLAPTGGEPSRCRVAAHHELPATALTRLPDVRLDRMDDRFALVGVEDGGATVRFASLTADGVLGAETAANVPAHVVGPWYGLVGKVEPGDQLAVVYGVARAEGEIELDVMTVGAGGADAPRALEGRPGVPLVLAAAPGDVRAAMASGRSGKVAAFTWGMAGRKAHPQLITLAADGVQKAEPGLVITPRDWDWAWDCLRMSPSLSELAVTITGPRTATTKSSWWIGESDVNANLRYALWLAFDTPALTIAPDTGCPAVATTAAGYVVAWQNAEGTSFATFDTVPSSGRVTFAMQAASRATSWAAQKQAPVAGLAAMGSDVAILHASYAGPQVGLYNVHSGARGGWLFLPSQGHPGPVSSWSTLGKLFVTYLDPGPAGAAAKRHFIEVTCPGT